MFTQYLKKLPPDWHRTAQIFTALGDPHRQKILLLFEPGERLNITQIAAVISLSRSAVVHHLRVLKEAGILKLERCGKESLYRIHPSPVRQALTTLLAYLDQQFEP